ncbi:hypothetical protein LCY76_19690 [Fictibacillus sp. KIGAM418]|uniref:Uncharacterized protein n=1 Tax=Fictibacillus marinisediminis TaxID=2878389 RepID=A0A9X1XJP5_9BACL|nr:hypothetical protein [Fictibacillus marinisediminis]MCK6258794.1 hypothetical protein [Fictibacillus marinisediminis]
MNFLNHKFQIVKEANIIIIKNSISNSALVTFKDNGIDLDKFKQIMYYGQSDETDGSLESLEMDKLINSFPFGFTSCSDNRMKSLFKFIRQYTEFFLPVMISRDLFEEYINRVEEIIIDKKIFDVYLSLGNSLPHLSKLLSEIPFLNVTEENDDIKKDKYDIVITKGRDYEKDKLWVQKSERILFLNVTQSKIEIGPLVFASKFIIPNIEFESINTSSTHILKQEESLICFFLERILYINFFELYDKTSGIEFFPTRSRICIDRMNLHGYGELVPMYPIQLEV